MIKLLIVLFLSVSFCQGATFRIFTSSNSGRQISARLIDYNPNSQKVKICRQDGKFFTTDILEFSFNDRVHIIQTHRNQTQVIQINRPNNFIRPQPLQQQNPRCPLVQPYLGNIMQNYLCNPRLMNTHDYGTIAKTLTVNHVMNKLKHNQQQRIIQPRARVINNPRPTTVIITRPNLNQNQLKNCRTCVIR